MITHPRCNGHPEPTVIPEPTVTLSAAKDLASNGQESFRAKGRSAYALRPSEGLKIGSHGIEAFGLGCFRGFQIDHP